jgi:hypothetical protein
MELRKLGYNSITYFFFENLVYAPRSRLAVFLILVDRRVGRKAKRFVESDEDDEYFPSPHGCV